MDETTISIAPELIAAADVARQYGHHVGSRSYSGVTAVPHTGITVYRVPDHDFDMHVRALVPDDIAVTFVDASHTRYELQVARELVWDLTAALEIQAVAIPVDGSSLRVVVAGSESLAQDVLDREVPGLATAQTSTTLTV